MSRPWPHRNGQVGPHVPTTGLRGADMSLAEPAHVAESCKLRVGLQVGIDHVHQVAVHLIGLQPLLLMKRIA